ncbi:MAG TPA: penicillin-binding protein activator LpoB [Chitinivibrionales bacterium]|nr:penicillin-binding protein activator LpoB [Chitinivibrionales bacterium]
MKYGRQFFLWAAVILFLAGCATKVTRIKTDSTTDLTGRWNDTDSRLVAEQMVSDCLGSAWLGTWTGGGKRPKVIIGTISNQSHEHISVGTFTKDIERALMNSGKIDFVAGKSERTQLREEKADMMAGNTSEATTKQAGNESGADLMMIGTLNTIVDQEGSKAVIYYQVNMELVNIETNVKAWMGEKKIKKYVERSTVTF